MGIACDESDAGKSGEFFRSALRIASSGNNASGGIFTMDAANGFASLGIRGGGDGACVEDNHSGVGIRFGGAVSFGEEILTNRSSIGLRGAAAKIADEKCSHIRLAALS